MAGQVCVDASVAVMFLLPHDLTPNVYTLWEAWEQQDIERLTAPLFFAEVTSVLREYVYHGRIAADEGERAFATFLRMRVKGISPARLQPDAWSLAKRYNRPRTYDAQYLAVATSLGCDLWTADLRLVNAVKEPWVRWVGEPSELRPPAP